ncbi:hypothetical protein [Citromicrobium bathyomarinum]|uniref:hypothetical protein n=1 Tax=Citromicrobium bathyomarinum TaxID=72174 RepID=UPI003159A994
MDRKFPILGPLVASAALFTSVAAGASPTPPPQAGRLDTLPIGSYQCTLPGDASGPAWHRVPEGDFKILNASSYEAKGSSGVYLLRGDLVTFTRGPLKGMSLERTGRTMLRERADDGSLGDMRCVRAGPVN